MSEQQHEAGRETDALVARAVMGIDTEEREWCEQWAPLPGGGTYHEQCQRCGQRRAVYGMTDLMSGPCRIRIPAYSADIAAAMSVFEAMVEMTGAGSISADMEDARGQGFIVGVSFGFDDESGGAAMGPLPLAICRAALAAVQS